MPLLTVNKLTKNFGGLTAVSHVNLELYENELVGLIGPNGAGKTTLFNLLTGVYEPSSGDVIFENSGKEQRLNGMKPYKIANIGLARTFQNIRLFKELSVLDNVLIAMKEVEKSSFIANVLRLPKYYQTENELADKAKKLLEISLEGSVG